VQDEDVPGAGAYDHKSTVNVKHKDKQHGIFKSGVDKGWNCVMGKDNPGTGEYENYH